MDRDNSNTCNWLRGTSRQPWFFVRSEKGLTVHLYLGLGRYCCYIPTKRWLNHLGTATVTVVRFEFLTACKSLNFEDAAGAWLEFDKDLSGAISLAEIAAWRSFRCW